MKHEAAKARRSLLVAQLPPVDQIVRGSLLRRVIHHRKACPKCAKGGGHVVWVLTVSYPGGKTKQISIRPEQRPLVEQWLKNYYGVRAKLEQICELNHGLIRPDA